MRQMLNQLRILDHIVFLVTINVRLSLLRDRPQLHSQRILCLVVVLHCVIIPSRPIIEFPPTQHRTVGEIQPKILRLIAFLALPP